MVKTAVYVKLGVRLDLLSAKKQPCVFFSARHPARGSTISTSTCTGRPRSSPPTSPRSSWTRTMSTPHTSAACRTPQQTTRSVLRLTAAVAPQPVGLFAQFLHSSCICCFHLFLPLGRFPPLSPPKKYQNVASPLLSCCITERNVMCKAPCWVYNLKTLNNSKAWFMLLHRSNIVAVA